MALKATINERCRNCGQRAARLSGRFIVESHVCSKAPPGPRPPPRRVPLDHFVFVPAEFTADELRSDLDAAYAEIDRLQDDASERKRRLDDVFVAMKGYVTNRIA